MSATPPSPSTLSSMPTVCRIATRSSRLRPARKLRHVGIGQIARQPRIDAGDIVRHAVEEVRRRCSAAAHPGSPCRFRPARRPRPAAGYLLWRRPRSARRYRRRAGRTRSRSRNAPDRARARSAASGAIPSTVSSGDKMRPLVEPFRHQKLGAGAGRPALAFDLDLDAHESLRRRVDDDRAEPERPGEAHRTFKKGDILVRPSDSGIKPALSPARFG